jgi:hypothetical protein
MRIVLICLLFISSHTWAQEDWSVYLEKANQDAANCTTFLEVMEAHKDDDTTARGYFALATMLQAKLYPNPFTKLSYFNKGKKILEATIESDPSNVELRFLRFAVQTEVPAILLYFGEIDEDQAMLDRYLEKGNDGLAKRIQKYYQLKGFDQKS